MIAGSVLRARARAFRNTLRPRGRGRGRAGQTLFAVALAVVLAALVTMALAALYATIVAEGAGARVAATALGLVLTATLVGLLVFDLHETVTTLLADSDLDLLRRAPLTPPTLFAIKLLDALPRTSPLLLVLALPAVLAYHAFFPLPAWGWLLLPAQLLALWAIPLGLGAALALQALRVVPARHAREGLGLLSTLVLFALWLANSFLLPRLAAAPDGGLGPVHDLLRAVPAAYALSPGTWLSSAVAAAAEGQLPEAVRSTALLLVAGAASLALAAAAAGAHLETIHLRLAAGSGRGRNREAARPAAPAGGFLGAMLRRDATLLARNWTVAGDLVTAAALWTLLPQVGRPLFDAPPVTIARAMLLALTVALGYEIAARAIPLERHGAAWARLAPVPATRWVTARYAGVAVLAAALLALAATGVAWALALSARELGGILAVVLPALAIALAIGLWTGAAFGDPAWANPRAMLTLPGRALATVMLLVQAGAWLVVAAVLDAGGAALPAGLAAWGPAAAAAVLVPAVLRAAAKRAGHAP